MVLIELIGMVGLSWTEQRDKSMKQLNREIRRQHLRRLRIDSIHFTSTNCDRFVNISPDDVAVIERTRSTYTRWSIMSWTVTADDNDGDSWGTQRDIFPAILRA